MRFRSELPNLLSGVVVDLTLDGEPSERVSNPGPRHPPRLPPLDYFVGGAILIEDELEHGWRLQAPGFIGHRGDILRRIKLRTTSRFFVFRIVRHVVIIGSLDIPTPER